jgi:uncharacterized protein DUF2393
MRESTPEKSASESAAMYGLLQSQATEKRKLFPIIAAVCFLAAAVAAILIFSGGSAKPPSAPPAYAANVKLTNVHMMTAENFIGSSVTYIEGTVANAGGKTLTGATVELTFNNSLKEVVQTEDLPVRVLRSSQPYRDFANLLDLPLAAGQSKEFRLSLEHISADWNQHYPDIRVIDVSTK